MSSSRRTEVLVVGGGSSGAALAGLVAAKGIAVTLLEAGPDYGSNTNGRWPNELLDARRLPGTHDWGYAGFTGPGHTSLTTFGRCRVIGGCSSHNGCVALSGHRVDYDAWAASGNAGWSWREVAPAFDRAKRALRVRLPTQAEATPFQSAFVTSAVANGIPLVADLDDPDSIVGIGLSPVNIQDGVRWNTAFAYLDPVRDYPNLTIVGDALVDRIEFSGTRAIAVHAIIGGTPTRLAAECIVLAAGAYGSPAILLRSGIGDPAALTRLGIRPRHHLGGVGAALADHPVVALEYRSHELDRAMRAHAELKWIPDEQALLKTRSSRCLEAFDLHLFTVSEHVSESNSWKYRMYVSCIAPRSTGRLLLESADPTAAPQIDHGYLSDPEGDDLDILVDGVQLARQIASRDQLGELLEVEVSPGPNTVSREQIAAYTRAHVDIYYHPSGTCRMGPSSDPFAVVDPQGRVHGMEDLVVCDASIFPRLMRANTNLPAVMAAEHLADRISTGAR